MKRGPKCPVCGSLQIKVLPESDSKDKDHSGNKEEGNSEKKGAWKCYDCYRHFEKPDETS